MVSDGILFQNAKVIDGSGNPWFRADVAVEGSFIVDIGKGLKNPGRIIDVEGLILSPGFVNIHGHSDSTILMNPRSESLLMQGVTTEVIGNCGYSLAPLKEGTKKLVIENFPFPLEGLKISWHSFGEYLKAIEDAHPSLNIVSLIGHGTIRLAVIGMEARRPTKDELDEMKALIAKAMEDGAFGLSSGLAYPPGFFADTEELVELCKVVADYGGFYATHIRGEKDMDFLKALKEALEIGERSGTSVQISHIETHYPSFGRQKDALRLLEEARIRGLDVTCDVPPYLYAYTALYSLLPEWMHEGGPEALLRRLSDPKLREKAILEIETYPAKTAARAMAKDGKWDKIFLSSCPRRVDLEGKSLLEVSSLMGRKPLEAVLDLLGLGPPFPTIMMEVHSEEDIREVLRHETSMIETDFYSGPVGIGKAHPRGYGTFPMIFRKYVRGETRLEMPKEKGEKLLSLEEAVRKMTSFPMQRLGIWDRGIVRKGMRADITIFDPKKIMDRATYENPEAYPQGIEYVLVNGQMVVEEGTFRGIRPGSVIRRNEGRRSFDFARKF
ncbi:MAG: D-aminoacylase [Candidatus Bathyarchaeia archaeon]